MKKYIAISKAITDISWNGVPKISEALGMFYVKPEIKTNVLGKKVILGFQEVITGEKIINRNSYVNEFDNIEYDDVDSKIDGDAQIGDVYWEVVEESETDELLSPKEFKKYMSNSREQILEQLKMIHEKAIKIGQTRENLELEHNKRYVKRNLDTNKIYVAIPRAVTDIYWNEISETSEALGMFCVKPDVKRDLLGNLVVTGFHEVITGEKIVNRKYCESDSDSIVEDEDCMIGDVIQIGDLEWDILDKSTADRLLSPEELQKYMSYSRKEILEQLRNVRLMARNIIEQSENDNKLVRVMER